MKNDVLSLWIDGCTRSAKRFNSRRAKRVLLGCAAMLCAATPLTGHAQVFTAPAPIQIPINTLTQGPASIYPASIMVSGVGTSVTGLSVTFLDLSHDYPDDIDVLLVGPRGQNVLLMSDTGGYIPVSHLTLTFSDAATSFLPDETVLSSGTYKPTNYDAPFTVDSFAAPAPLTGPYGSTLSVFNGTNPNGVWSLYVLDDTAGNSGSMASGWSLNITAVPEPSSLAFAASALAITGWIVVRRRGLAGARG